MNKLVLLIILLFNWFTCDSQNNFLDSSNFELQGISFEFISGDLLIFDDKHIDEFTELKSFLRDENALNDLTFENYNGEYSSFLNRRRPQSLNFGMVYKINKFAPMIHFGIGTAPIYKLLGADWGDTIQYDGINLKSVRYNVFSRYRTLNLFLGIFKDYKITKRLNVNLAIRTTFAQSVINKLIVDKRIYDSSINSYSSDGRLYTTDTHKVKPIFYNGYQFMYGLNYAITKKLLFSLQSMFSGGIMKTYNHRVYTMSAVGSGLFNLGLRKLL